MVNRNLLGLIWTVPGFKSSPKFEFVRPGRIYQVDSYSKIFWVPKGKLDEELRNKKSRIEIRACYCSIYDECWIETNKKDPVQVYDCSPYPTIRYGGILDNESQ